jgi:hypothetical protein
LGVEGLTSLKGYISAYFINVPIKVEKILVRRFLKTMT